MLDVTSDLMERIVARGSANADPTPGTRDAAIH
jgi:hypothetical protein